MALELDYEVAWLAEVQLPAPSNTQRYATRGDVVDETSARYNRGLLTPSIRRETTSPTYGVPVKTQITLEIAAAKADEPVVVGGPPGANPAIDAFYDVEPRGAVVKIRRLNLRTGTLVTRLVGVVERVSVRNGKVSIEVSDTRADAFEDIYPRVLVDTATFPDATSESFALNLPVPLHFGAHREHSPCRYVSGVDRPYAPGQSQPKIFGHHRYVVGHTMPKLSTGGYANVVPHVAALYRGVAIGAALANRGEYVERVNVPMLPISGGLTISLVAGGDLSLVLTTYEVTAWNGVAEGHTSAAISTTPTGGNRTARLGWPFVAGAIGYRIRRNTQLIAQIAGGDVVTFDDTGSAFLPTTFTVTIPTLTTTQVGGNTLEVIFPQAQRSADDQLASILADVDATEMGWDPDVRGLWHFRDSGIRDSTPSYHTYWRRSSVVAFWGFFTAVDRKRSLTGNNALVELGMDVSDYVDGPYKPVWQGDAISTYFRVGTPVGLDFAGGSFRIDFVARADEDTTGRANMRIIDRWPGGSGPGFTLGINDGVLTALLGDGTDVVAAIGTTVWDGAWHRGTLVVDRSNSEMYLEVDGVADSPFMDISLVGSISTVADVLIGVELRGQIDWIVVDTNVNPIANLVLGKSGLEPSAIDFALVAQQGLTIRNASPYWLDLGTSDFEIEAWFKLSDVPPSGSARPIYRKLGGAAGVNLEVANVGGVVVVRANVQGAGNNVTATSSTSPAIGRWHYASMAVTGGFLTAYLDAVPGTPVAVVSLNVDTTADAWVGYDGSTLKLDGAIDELRITARARTMAERREVLSLGRRNLVTQARQLLESAQHGPGLTVHDAEWTAAAAVVDGVQVSSPAAPGQFVTDLAIAEQRPLKDHLAEWLKLRGVRLQFAADGTLGISVDAQRSAVAKYGFFDATWRNALDRPERSQSPLDEAVKRIRVVHRRKRRNAGEVDRFTMKSALKTVLTVGASEPRQIECAAVRDPGVAEITNHYFGERMILADQAVQFETADESALLVNPGDLVTLDDPMSGRAVQTLEVLSLEERGHRFALDCVAWASSIYGWVAITPATPPTPESEPDYSATLPQAITGLGVVFASSIQNDGRRVWQATATWTPPTGINVALVVVEWKPSASTVWRPGATVQWHVGSVVLEDLFDDAATYNFRAYATNKFGLAGAVGSGAQVTAVTTNPDAPTNPDTAASPGSWSIGLTGTQSSHRARRWQWAKHPAKNLDYYEWEVYAAASGGSPIATVGTGTTRNTYLTYMEGGLQRGTQRFCQVRAVNKSGLASQYSSRIVGAAAEAVTGGASGDLGDNGTVATNDAAANAFTRVTYNTGFVTTTTSMASACKVTHVLAGGYVVLTGYVYLSAASWTAASSIQIEIRRAVTGGNLLTGTVITAGYDAYRAGAATNLWLSLPLSGYDGQLLSGSYDYSVNVKHIGVAAVVQARLNVVELKR